MTAAVRAPASPEPVPLTRSFADIIARRIRVTLGGIEWPLPVLSVGQNEDWQRSLDTQTASVLADVDEEDLPAMLTAVLSLGVDALLRFVYEYDVTGVLPRDTDGNPAPEFRRSVYPYELLPAVWEVSLAANPTADLAVTTAIEGLREMGRQTADAMPPSAPTKSSRPRTAGRRRRSGTN